MVESRSNQGPSAATSVLKNAGTKVGQERAELILEVMGTQGLGWEGEGFTADELAAVRGWLGGKATTIYRRLGRNPEQHHLQADPRPARPAGSSSST